MISRNLKRSFVPAIVLALLFVSSVATATEQVTLEGYRFEFRERKYDSGKNRTQFKYKVYTEDSAVYALSHLVIGYPNCGLEVVAYEPTDAKTSLGLDPTTGVSGIKFDESPLGDKDYRYFSVFFKGDVPLGTVTVAAKAGTAVSTGTLPGAYCKEEPPVSNGCQTTDVMVVMDQSGSMADAFNGVVKYTMAKNALSSVLTTHESKVRFGLSFFPSSGSCGTTSVATIEPGYNQKDEIMAEVNAKSPDTSKWTPLLDTLKSLQVMMAKYPNSARNVLLITDGREYCHPDKNDAAKIQGLLKVEALKLAAMGVKVFTVGIGDDLDAKALNYITYYSGAVTNCNPESSSSTAADNCYFGVGDTAGLTKAMGDIIVESTKEICDGKDNNCDGRIDEVEELGYVECGLGECHNKVEACKDGKPVTCVPKDNATAEICDGKDNNCNGQIDENLGVGDSCSAGVGECKRDGKKICGDNGSVICNATPGAPQTEVCDGKDNNCDGKIDEGFDLGKSCSAGVGECKRDGKTVCDGSGKSKCDAVPGEPKTEICDGKDNNCNGKIDENLGVGDTCVVGIGACESIGKKICGLNGTVICDGTPGKPTKEICDGVDNDCNGKIDDVEGLGGECSVGVGACARKGTWICSDKGLVCSAKPGEPTKEICDGIDNNCDGQVDEGLGTLECGVGACHVKVSACVDGKPQTCTPGTPSPEVCDGIDNNCNGQVDEGLADKTITCGKGQCERTVKACVNGKPGTCTPGEPEKETCDSVDNDCDGKVDNDACENGVCFCGTCMQPCGDGGYCPDGLVCLNELCMKATNCPEGQVCDTQSGQCGDPKEPTNPGDQGTTPTDPNDPGDQGTDPKDPKDPGDQGTDPTDPFGTGSTDPLGTGTAVDTNATGKNQNDDSYRGGACQTTPGGGSSAPLWLTLLAMVALFWRRRTVQ